MDDFINSLKGYKTYVVLGLAALTWLLAATGVIENSLADTAYGILTVAGGSTMVAKINRLAGKANK